MTAAAEQRTDAWRQERAGNLTASTFYDIIALKRDGNPTAERSRLMRRKAFERMAGIAEHEIGGRALSWGKDLEDAATETYEIETGLIVQRSGYVVHPKYPYIGASPDGLVGALGGIETKCPHDEAVHVQTWLEGMPEIHKPQVQGNMMVTERQWWDFISYDPRQSERFRLYIQRVPRDDDYCDWLLKQLLQFEVELRTMVKTLEKRAANQEQFLADLASRQAAA